MQVKHSRLVVHYKWQFYDWYTSSWFYIFVRDDEGAYVRWIITNHHLFSVHLGLYRHDVLYMYSQELSRSLEYVVPLAHWIGFTYTHAHTLSYRRSKCTYVCSLYAQSTCSITPPIIFSLWSIGSACFEFFSNAVSSVIGF